MSNFETPVDWLSREYDWEGDYMFPSNSSVNDGPSDDSLDSIGYHRPDTEGDVMRFYYGAPDPLPSHNWIVCGRTSEIKRNALKGYNIIMLMLDSEEYKPMIRDHGIYCKYCDDVVFDHCPCTTCHCETCYDLISTFDEDIDESYPRPEHISEEFVFEFCSLVKHYHSPHCDYVMSIRNESVFYTYDYGRRDVYQDPEDIQKLEEFEEHVRTHSV